MHIFLLFKKMHILYIYVFFSIHKRAFIMLFLFEEKAYIFYLEEDFYFIFIFKIVTLAIFMKISLWRWINLLIF